MESDDSVTDSDSDSSSDSDSDNDRQPVAKMNKQSGPVVGSDVLAFLGTLGYQQYATPLARAGFASMAELALITSKSLKACKVLDGHALRTLDELKKRCALGVVPPKKLSKRPGHFFFYGSAQEVEVVFHWFPWLVHSGWGLHDPLL